MGAFHARAADFVGYFRLHNFSFRIAKVNNKSKYRVLLACKTGIFPRDFELKLGSPSYRRGLQR